ncbi:hypothetical protein M413DRAFT_444469 [Hebeloma cylindrosporum]|uniref:Uncharacterized protein n=1 Tax=Hebeloma cylindrosporum TaxID=76867 RepID=A0A0C2YP50_HEBCY|nr:hypothetical protein M413DRAFT_444469 [Hebeloma cylindrosporum h7]
MSLTRTVLLCTTFVRPALDPATLLRATRSSRRTTPPGPHTTCRSSRSTTKYYFDIRGDGCLGPPLIYRTSKDQFTPPTGPENDPRPMRLLQVDDHAKLGKDDLWPAVRDKVRELLED